MKETSLSNVIFVENDSHSVHVFVSLCTLLTAVVRMGVKGVIASVDFKTFRSSGILRRSFCTC